MSHKTTSSLLFLIAFTPVATMAMAPKRPPKLTPPNAAPVFTIQDVNGNTIDLVKYKGKKVLMTFYRNVGCPVCNLRFHELQEQAQLFKAKGLVVLAVYESSPENMKQYLQGETPYATMIPDSDLRLYQLYDIERSTGKMMRGMFHGAMSKMKKGKKLFERKIKQDGNSNRIGADFLIDENGNIAIAYYGKFVGDHLPMKNIQDFIN